MASSIIQKPITFTKLAEISWNGAASASYNASDYSGLLITIGENENVFASTFCPYIGIRVDCRYDWGAENNPTAIMVQAMSGTFSYTSSTKQTSKCRLYGVKY